jgi:hypothetical protein
MFVGLEPSEGEPIQPFADNKQLDGFVSQKGKDRFSALYHGVWAEPPFSAREAAGFTLIPRVMPTNSIANCNNLLARAT